MDPSPARRHRRAPRRRLALALLLPLAAAMLPALPATAGPVERACLRSDRQVNPALCDCIQRIADRTLTRRDQRQAARFFRDPQRAQDVRMSTRAADDAFWDRYTAFGSAAARACD